MVCKEVNIDILVGNNIKALRKAHKLSQEELGEVLGVSKAQVSHIETGKSWITKKDVEKLAKLFNVEQHVLFQIDSKNRKV